MALAGLLAAALLATVLVLVADPWPSVWLPGVAVNGALTAAGGGLLLAVRVHVTPWMRHLVLGLGTLGLASAVVYGGGGAPTALFSLMYVWVGVYAGAHMKPSGVLTHLGLAGVTATTALLVVDPPVAAADREFEFLPPSNLSYCLPKRPPSPPPPVTLLRISWGSRPKRSSRPACSSWSTCPGSSRSASSACLWSPLSRSIPTIWSLSIFMTCRYPVQRSGNRLRRKVVGSLHSQRGGPMEDHDATGGHRVRRLRGGAAMDTAVIVAIVVAAVLVIAVLIVVSRSRAKRVTEERRVEAGEHRDEARIQHLEADRSAAEAEERSARAKREAAAAEQQSLEAEQRRGKAVASEERARDLDPDQGS